MKHHSLGEDREVDNGVCRVWSLVFTCKVQSVAQPKFFSWLRQSDKRSLRHFDAKRRQRQSCVSVKPWLEVLEDRVVPSTITLPLQNETGLNPSQYSIYVLGFSVASGLVLDGSGQFVTPGAKGTGTSTSYAQGYEIGSTISSITLDTTKPLNGARVYLFVEPSNQPAPELPFVSGAISGGVSQPQNPPTTPTFSGLPPIPGYSYPSGLVPYDIVEITVDGATPTDPDPNASDIHIDVQTVDGFIFPLTLTEENQGVPIQGGQVGQPWSLQTLSSTVNLQDIITAYKNFMNGQPNGSLYKKLLFSSIDGQAGILNPGLYLAEAGNSTDPLNGVWTNTLNQLFSAQEGTLSLIGPDGNYYQSQLISVTDQNNKSDSVLKFTGYSPGPNSTLGSPNGNVFYIYNPTTPDPYVSSETAGRMVFANDGIFSDTSPNVFGLASPWPATSPPSPSLAPSITQQPASQDAGQGTAVTFTATASPSGKQAPTVQWQVLSTGGSTWTTLSNGAGVSGANSTTLTLTNLSTSMNGNEYRAVFTNGQGTVTTGSASLEVVSGMDPRTIVKDLENQIVSALNRGVALDNQNNWTGVTDGYTSYDWADENSWYPSLTPGGRGYNSNNYENLFSLFMHTATFNGTPIFTQPTNPANNAQNQPMGQAYGFGYDETPMAIPTQSTPANVPSKFDPASSQATSITITLGPWFTSPPPSPPSSGPSPTASLTLIGTGWTPTLLFLAEDRFSLEVDSMASMFSNDPLFTQAADRAMSAYNNLLGLYNPALFTGLSGLQSAIYANPYSGTVWEMVGQAAGFDWADHSKDWGPWTQSLSPVVALHWAAEQFVPAQSVLMSR